MAETEKPISGSRRAVAIGELLGLRIGHNRAAPAKPASELSLGRRGATTAGRSELANGPAELRKTVMMRIVLRRLQVSGRR